MRWIRFGVFVVVSFFVVFTLLSLLFPSDIRVSRVVNVAASRQRLSSVVSDLKTWREWNAMLDTSLLTHIRYSSPSGGAGASIQSDQMRIDEKQADTAGVALHWSLTGGKQFVGGFQFLAVNPDSISVQWWFELHFRWYPWEKLGVFVYDRKLGPVMEESLDRLRQYVEKPR